MDKGYADALYEDYRIRQWVRANLKNASVARVEIERPGGTVKIILHSAKPGIIIGRGGKGVEEIKAAMEKLSSKTCYVSVQEIHHPDIDAQLVSESIAQQIEKRIAYKRAMRQAIMRAMKLGVKGVRVMCSGRLAGAEMARREQNRDGKIPLHTLRADIDYGFAEALTTYGHIGIKVWIYKGDVLPGGTRLTEDQIVPRRESQRAERGERGDRGGRGGRGGRSRRGGSNEGGQPRSGRGGSRGSRGGQAGGQS
jgi:small subunit ribosomal protein S3